MEFVSLTIEPAKQSVIALLRHVSYIFRYKKRLESFENKAESLWAKRNDVVRLLEEGRTRLEEPTEEVQLWLERVVEIEEALKKLNEDITKHPCLCGQGLSWSWRYKISKLAMRKEDDIVDMLEKSNFKRVLHDAYLPPAIELNPSRDFIFFKSTEYVMGEVLQMLDDPEMYIIGLHGMGGVGKTSLMKEVAKKLKKNVLFDEVLMVTVSQKPDLKKIQQEISEQLGLRLHEENIAIRARRLSARLRNEKRVLVVLDDVWEYMPLEEVGIPDGEVHKGCKLVVTTRNTNVCAMMGCQAKIVVEVLSEEDSWSLFSKNAGTILNTSNFLDIGKKVVKECGGLPLAIVTLGRALRDKDRSFWENALSELRRSSPLNIDGVSSNIFSPLMLSYEAIESEETKLVFLLCCLFPEDHNININRLVQYMIALGPLADVETLAAASGRVYLFLNKLKSSALLLDGDRDGYVKMHDVVRDVAVHIASQDAHGFVVKAGQKLKEWQARERLEKCKRISLMNNLIDKLSDLPPCPQLQILLLTNNRTLTEIPDNFFERMESLRVLDLSNTRISVLPRSLSGLRNLRSISLTKCTLRDISILGHLQELEFLRLKGCNLYRLPEEIGLLRNLRLLDLSNTGSLKAIPPQLISKLSCLEVLYMGNSFNKWEAKCGTETNQASISEVLSLSALTILNIHINDANCLLESTQSVYMDLKKFCICVNTPYVDSSFPLAMHLNIPNPVSPWISPLLEKTEELKLSVCEGLKNLCQLHAGEFKSLMFLQVKECSHLEHLIHGESSQQNVFKKLMELHLSGLPNFVGINDGNQLHNSGSFVNLKIMSIHKCDKLARIMTSETLKMLQNLVDLEVSRCDEMQEVFDFEGVGEDQAVLANMKRLKLRHLPKLVTIAKGKIPHGTLQNLVELYVKGCARLGSIMTISQAKQFVQLMHLDIINLEHLTRLISCEEINASQKSLQDQCIVSQPTFQNLQLLSVERFKVTKILLPLGLIHCLLNLKMLKVRCCFDLEEITADENLDVGVLPRLQSLILYRLPNLRSFSSGKLALDFPCLKHLKIWRCPKLKSFPLGLESAPMLATIEGLDVDWFEGMEWKDEATKVRLRTLFRG